jgi:hypothetical protein
MRWLQRGAGPGLLGVGPRHHGPVGGELDPIAPAHVREGHPHRVGERAAIARQAPVQVHHQRQERPVLAVGRSQHELFPAGGALFRGLLASGGAGKGVPFRRDLRSHGVGENGAVATRTTL